MNTTEDPAELAKRLASTQHFSSRVYDEATVAWAREQAGLPEESSSGFSARLHEYADGARTCLELIVEEDRSSHTGGGRVQQAIFAVSRAALLESSPDTTIRLVEVNGKETDEPESVTLPADQLRVLGEAHSRLHLV